MALVERRRQDAPGLELGERALQDRLIGPLRHLLADQAERGVHLALAGEQARLRLDQAHRRRTIVRHAVAQHRLGLVRAAGQVEQHGAVIDVERAQRFALAEPRQALLRAVLAVLAEHRPGIEEGHDQAGDAALVEARQALAGGVEPSGAGLVQREQQLRLPRRPDPCAASPSASSIARS